MIEKMDGKTVDIVKQNIKDLKRLFPEVVMEGKVDFDRLRLVLGDEVESGKERYEFTWPGKANCIRLAQQQSTGTLRPDKGSSVDWDITQNVFIEGDNLEVLRLLQKSYHRKVKMIYIDPPYNTGNDFIYKDDFRDNLKNYLNITGQSLVSNPETSGRYHTDWLNMIYPRLEMAKNLLKDDGSIFISIDDNEVTNLRKVCDEVFGEENFITTIIWQKVYSPKNSAKFFSEDHDYILLYVKNIDIWRPNLLPRTEEANARYTNSDNDPRGPWKSSDLTARNYYGEGTYEIVGPTGRKFTPGKGRYWRQSFDNFQKMVADNRIWWGPNGDSTPAQKRFLSEVKDGITPQTLWMYSDVGHTQDAKKELLEYVEFENTENVLNSVKPVKLIDRILDIATNPNDSDIVLDFFAGSGTTAHAVLMKNFTDYGNRRFILVQVPEPLKTPEDKVKTIADLAKSRIRSVSERISKQIDEQDAARADELGSQQNVGSRNFILDSSNLLPWDPDAEDIEAMLTALVDPVKDDRNADDVLFEIMIKYGIDLAMPIEEITISGKSCYSVGKGYMVVCLEQRVTLDVVEGIAALKPERVVFKDMGFADDNVKTNAVQLLKKHGIEDFRSV